MTLPTARFGFRSALVAFLALCAFVLGAGEPRLKEAREPLEQLEIITASGPHAFSVEVMRTDEQRQRGLMFRRSLPPDQGMLFAFEREQPVMMWMKNTFLPLDMVFIGKFGKIVGLAENTEPLSERIIPSGAPVIAVLEVNAGVASRIGLKIGDEVRHPILVK